ncbi:MAG: fructose-bisphosphate aldolase class I [Magnetococcales bacterium]|nr:fructose-bisphosphate aldolase class I [Magnetococcales bacterium]|tara:strand:+ start:11119 stop:12147 length:1029 start_codon:yes stop_codon:yes gene_type:complete
MNTSELAKIANKLVAKGKGILAADESTSTAGKRLTSIGLENTEKNRRDMREMFFTAKGIEDYISGVILYDETLRQSSSHDVPFTSILAERNIIPGIKVDEGLEDIGNGEKTTKGLETLASRLEEYYKLGARFAKWRAVYSITDALPSQKCYSENAARLAKYAKLCQEAGIVPIVEPEVLMDDTDRNTHSLERADEVVRTAHTALFDALAKEGVHLPGVLLKPSMVIPGKNAETKATEEQVASWTYKALLDTVPEDVAGVVFLSGGQSDEDATAHLDKMNKIAAGNNPWPLTFSYGRALQGAALQTWKGKEINLAMAQSVFIHRAHCNSLAAKGEYSKDIEAA